MSEVLVAQGADIATQGIKVSYENLNSMQPKSRFPRIYKTYGNGETVELTLTPAEGKFVRDSLVTLFSQS